MTIGKYMENIEKIRNDAIVEIKEKVKKNPGYLHPCNKERLEYMNRLKFTNGNDFTRWMQQNGIMKNPADISRKKMEKTIENAGCKTYKEYSDKCAQKAGFKDRAERQREWRHYIEPPLSELNEDCPTYFGVFTENLVIQTFEEPIKMPYGNPGFDWTCKRGDKIDNKSRCLDYIEYRPPCWIFPIRYNNIADWFILSAWDSRNSLNPLHVWTFHKDDLVRGRKFWERQCISINNTSKGLKEFEKYEVTNRLDKLKELCSRI